jgi:hypothetical protein
MKICIVILCVLAAPAFAQDSKNEDYLSFYLRYDSREPNLSGYEEGRLLDYVYDLFLSESVIIDILRTGSSYSDDALTEQRYNYFVELCKEYQISDATARINIVTSRFEEDEQAHVRVLYQDPSSTKKFVRREGVFTHPDGWRASCFLSDVPFLQRTDIRVFRTPEELQELNLLTVDEVGNRLEVFAVVSVSFANDTVLPNTVKFHIPLHGISEIGCMEYALMSNSCNTFPSNGNKAAVKREDGVMLWKLDTNRSGMYVIAGRAPDPQIFKFNAPEGYAILGAHASSMSPYMSVEATVASNQLSATFSNMPAPERVTCEFTLVDLNGTQYTIAAVSAKMLLNDSFLSFLRKGDPVLPENLVAQKVMNK